MPECCLLAGEQLKADKAGQSFLSGTMVSSVLAEGLLAVHELMCGNGGYEFDMIFENTMRERLEKLTLERTDIEDFMKIARTGGCSDCLLQLKIFRNVKDILTGRAEALKKDAENKGRIMMGLGTMGGIFLLIVLL
jgi:hypothetical protein